MLKMITAALAVLAMMGCATPQQRADQVHNHCTAMGFTPGTPFHAQCMYNTWAQLEAQRSAARQNMLRQGVYMMNQSGF